LSAAPVVAGEVGGCTHKAPVVAWRRKGFRKICAISQHDPAKEAEIGGIVLSFGRIIPDFFR
jgi:hypothetical protein